MKPFKLEKDAHNWLVRNCNSCVHAHKHFTVGYGFKQMEEAVEDGDECVLRLRLMEHLVKGRDINDDVAEAIGLEHAYTPIYCKKFMPKGKRVEKMGLLKRLLGKL